MDLAKVFEQVIEGDSPAVESSVKTALAEGMQVDVILKDGLTAAMDEVGRRFEEGELFVPETLMSARAMQSGLNLLKPYDGTHALSELAWA